MSSLKYLLRATGIALSAALIFTSCNKDLPDAEPIVYPSYTGPSAYTVINGDANYTYLAAAIAKASGYANPAGKLDALLKDSTGIYTFFAPDNAAFQRSFQALGLPTEITTIQGFPAQDIDAILRYHLIGGRKLGSAEIGSDFPNMYLQSTLVLKAPAADFPPGLRMSVFPTKRGSNLFVNNFPVQQADISFGNAIAHKIPYLLMPPKRMLKQRIDTDPSLTYLKAAIARADAGQARKDQLDSLLNFAAANFTVFAPTDDAFKALLTAQIKVAALPLVKAQYIQAVAAQLMAGDPALTQEQAIAMATVVVETEPHVTNIQNLATQQAAALASTPDVFTNPLLADVLTPTTVKGIVVYHMFGKRAFLNNFPVTAENKPTLLNMAIPDHQGVAIQATFGPAGVTAATIKGKVNSTASNISINPTPEPGGGSDQHYVNGVLHKIDQVLRPQ